MAKRKLAASCSTACLHGVELNSNRADNCFIIPCKRPELLQEEIVIRPAGSGSSSAHMKVRKRKSRAKPKSPIKELSANKLNFREMVHQHTGLLLHVANHAHEAETSSASACSSSPSYDLPIAVNSSMPNYNMESMWRPPLPSFVAPPVLPSEAANEPQLINMIYPTKAPAYNKDSELMITNSNFIKLACVLLQHITSELSSNMRSMPPHPFHHL
ncbi:hypothetical protein GOP47_0008662 [Adiantum capillus-veneris]|uniref:Uncharacterized protein n=1 Tax=Adiantum capillus-veneris TaxID=13818 RepID=A0A9D4ZJY1_ADICA|nr:hypothetical protein GOP47_0008662 [Adiantum capillus-veneris]